MDMLATEGLPVLRRHEGIWDGRYRHFDADDTLVDAHASRLVCRFPAEDAETYFQTNIYTWDDGTEERRDFPATIRDGRLVFHNELIDGWAADVGLDEFARTTMLRWVPRSDPESYLYEMIQLSDCGNYRSRVWQRYRDGRLVGRTLIDEEKVASDWSDYPLPGA